MVADKNETHVVAVGSHERKDVARELHRRVAVRCVEEAPDEQDNGLIGRGGLGPLDEIRPERDRHDRGRTGRFRERELVALGEDDSRIDAPQDVTLEVAPRTRVQPTDKASPGGLPACTLGRSIGGRVWVDEDPPGRKRRKGVEVAAHDGIDDQHEIRRPAFDDVVGPHRPPEEKSSPRAMPANDPRERVTLVAPGHLNDGMQSLLELRPNRRLPLVSHAQQGDVDALAQAFEQLCGDTGASVRRLHRGRERGKSQNADTRAHAATISFDRRRTHCLRRPSSAHKANLAGDELIHQA